MSRVELEHDISLWRKTKEQRLAADKVASALKSEETALKNKILGAMISEKYEGVVLGGRITSAVEKSIPVVADRQALEEYILSSKTLSLLQFRLSSATVKEMREEGIEIPGVTDETIYELSDKKS